jgi:hypothetical protein
LVALRVVGSDDLGMGRSILGILILLVGGLPCFFPALANEDSGRAPVMVVGFVGGFVRPDDTVHSPVQVAGRIRAAYPTGVYVKVFQNHRREDAHQEILKMLDVDHDGKLSEEERKNARIIIYGMSWGGSETVALARELQGERIPVLLTIQVDSVSKLQGDDSVIPANVAEAANFYESDGMLHGKTQIRAADPGKTKILGNFRYQYAAEPAECAQYPWWDRLFVKPHTEIECDPVVWRQVETLIVGKVAGVVTSAAGDQKNLGRN